MEAIALLLVWCVRISVDFDMQSNGRKAKRHTRIRVHFGFGARGRHGENDDEQA